MTVATTTLTAKKLIVTAQELNLPSVVMGEPEPTIKDTQYDFEVWEFSNGLILVSSDTTNDWFFKDRSEIEANGTAIIIDTAETEDATEWEREWLIESARGSYSEFGSLDELKKIKELVGDFALEAEQDDE